MTLQRVAVIGGGIIGLFTAHELMRQGVADVTVVEQGHPGNGSSARSVGMVETQYLERADIAVRGHARQVYTSLEHDHDLLFHHRGYLRLGRSNQDVERFERSIAEQVRLGITDATVLTPEEISRLWPQLQTDDLAGGQFGSWDGYVDGYEVVQLLCRLVRARGGRVLSRRRLEAATRTASEWHLTVGDQVIRADFVVNAAGAWAGQVGRMLDADVRLHPQRRGAVTIELGGERPFIPFVMDYVPGSGRDGLYFRSERADQLIAGLHTDEITGAAASPDAALGALRNAEVELIATLLADRLTDVDDINLGRSWTGLYPTSPDHRPVVGPHPSNPTVICALGAGGSGIQLAPPIALMAASDITEATIDIRRDDWSASRITRESVHG